MCTPTGSTERQVVPRSHRKPEPGDAGKSGWGDLQALGAKSRTRRNIKIGDGNKRLKSKLIAIKNPHSDGKEAKEAKEVASLWRNLEARERHAEMVSQHKDERKLKENEMAENEGGRDARRDGSDA
ncbi:hypothetical protein HOY80DRAFT_1068855 [Tuber brumale]|nr:hypothetical protein HOY80DRAFT_1068855 [Tuber brumale]